MSVARRRRPWWWNNGGLNDRQETIFKWLSTTLIVLFAAAWVVAIIDSRTTPAQVFDGGTKLTPPPRHEQAAPVTSRVSNAILGGDAPTTAFINDAVINAFVPLRGESGKLLVAVRKPGETVVDPHDESLNAQYSGEEGVVVSEDFRAPDDPGVYKIAVELNRATRPIEDISLVTLVPFTEKRQGKIGLYYLGTWPYEKGGKPRSERYANPSGFIEVTPENRDLKVSEHFRLGDFLTKDQPNKWPKYVLLDPKLLDKLELTIMELEKNGVDVKHMQVMSGFRTPRYNAGGGNTAGRASTSRHMYGDASDVFVDNDRNGSMDDINGDGRVTVADAEMIGAAAERVERKHPSLIGGVGVYVACCGHGPFTHIDVRGYRARWRGTGNG